MVTTAASAPAAAARPPTPPPALPTWGACQFGDAALGDVRRTRRLIHLADAALAHPAGKVTQVCPRDADRQGAYALLANPAVTADALAAARHRATGRLAAAYPFVFVSVDGSSYRVTDTRRTKGTGPIGKRAFPSRGFKVMSALAVAPSGATLGLCGQATWTRSEQPVGKDRHQRTLDEKETRYWDRVCVEAETVLAAEAPGTRPWFQKDREADSAELLLRDLTAGRLITVRANHDRRVCGPLRRVQAQLAATPLGGIYTLHVPGSDHRQARQATIEVRWATVDLEIHERPGTRGWAARVSVVWAREVGTTPAGEDPIDWMLYTTYPVEDFGDALLVLVGYSYRWRIEEFHKTWKSGACRIGDTELRAADRIAKWATLLGAVATRLMQLRDAARTTPDDPATAWFSDLELRALRVLRRTQVTRPEPPRTLGQALRWIAELGGYTGKSSGGPPGLIVLKRGWDKVQLACEVLQNLLEPER